MNFSKIPHFKVNNKVIAHIVLKLFIVFQFFTVQSQISLKQSFGDNITPKSIVTDGKGLFSAQNMMYKHTVTLYSSQGRLLNTISDAVNLNDFGFNEYEDVLYRGSPVEACFTPDGKYLWVSNYAMYGPGFTKEGCDACSGDDYDPSFLYKINANTYHIESVVKVGSVPKFLTISDNGKLLLVSNWTSSDVSIIDLDTENEIKRVKVGSRPRGIVVDKKNQQAYVAIMGSDKIAVINLLNYSVKYIENVGRGPRHLILDESNVHLYVAVNSANKLFKINLLTRESKVCKTNLGPRSMVLSQDEKYLYVVNYFSNSFQKVNAETMAVMETVSTQQKPIGITGDWKSGNIWVSCYSGKIQMFTDPSLPIKEQTAENHSIFKMPRIKLSGLVFYLRKIPKQVESESLITAKGLKKDHRMTQKSRAEDILTANTSNSITTSISGGGEYNIIVGSFSVPENAKSMQDLLKTQNIASTLIPSSTGKMTMVSVGNFTDSEKANNQLKILKLEHDLNAWIFKAVKQ